MFLKEGSLCSLVTTSHCRQEEAKFNLIILHLHNFLFKTKENIGVIPSYLTDTHIRY